MQSVFLEFMLTSAAFGGYKSSGIGRELGSYALDAYTQTKAIHVNLSNRL